MTTENLGRVVGFSILSGAGVPSVGLGDNGDSYLNTTNGDVYLKDGGVWGSPTGNIRGIQGVQGFSVLSGAGAPTTQGVDGDSYLNTTNGDTYLKSSGIWSLNGNIKGIQGDKPTINTNSSTSNTIATGFKTFTLTTPLDLTVGQIAKAYSLADPNNYMCGFITSLSPFTINVSEIGGSGTKTDWVIALSGFRGVQGISTPNMSSGKVLGRNTAGVGTPEELTPVGLTLSSGTITATYDNQLTTYVAASGVDTPLTNAMSPLQMFQNLQKQNDNRYTKAQSDARYIPNTGTSLNLIKGDGTYQALSTLPAFTATKLLTARNINGVAFDGSANITIADSTKIPTSEKGANNGVATLDSGGKIPSSQLPDLAITDTFAVASQAAMLALTAQVGDIAIRSDISKTFILRVEPATTLSNWSELLNPTNAVTSVAGKTGVVTLVKADVGLSNVDNTADSSKPVSTAQQTALDLKANIASPTFTGTPSLPTGTTGVTQTAGDNSTKLATTSFVADALALKAGIAATTGTLVALTFTSDSVQGTVASPLTGNITGNITGAKLGVVTLVIHKHTTAPTFDSKYKKLSGSGSYVTGSINYIFCEYINDTEIIYSINQRT